jgi:putative ABC transport system substrate-binding protein
VKRREFITLLGSAAAAWPLATRAQQPAGKVPRVGVLSEGGRDTFGELVEAFQHGLLELGYVEGRNIIIENRWANGEHDRLRSLAAELVRLDVDIIIAAGGAQPVLAAKQFTTTLPIVMTNVADPVRFGIVAALARPGANITGLSNTPTPELPGKRLGLLKEVLPKRLLVAVLWDPSNPGSMTQKPDYETASSSLEIELQFVETRTPDDLEQAFFAIKGMRAEALVTINSPHLTTQLNRIIDLAVQNGLPTMSSESRWTKAGGFISYGVSYSNLYRRAASYVDKILKGAKPGDLPIEQPTKFELVVNLKAAKALRLEVSPTLLARADEVIE